MNVSDMVSTIQHSPHSRIFDWDWKSKTNFFKQFIAGLGIVLAMNGLDQNMMQKNLTCKTKKEAQKNVYWFSFAFIIANMLFLSLGVLLYFYASEKGIQLPARTDDLFPTLAMHYFGTFAGILFLLGILSAAYSSADSALTALTTSFCIDFLNMKADAPNEKRTRLMVHIGFSFLLFLVIIIFRAISNESVVMAVFKVAGYTYGPLLGLFTFGIVTKRKVKDAYVPLIGLVSPLITYVISVYSVSWFGGYKFGFELLWLNALITFIGLWLISNHTNSKNGLLQ
jgi:Na+/proline symporter